MNEVSSGSSSSSRQADQGQRRVRKSHPSDFADRSLRRLKLAYEQLQKGDLSVLQSDESSKPVDIVYKLRNKHFGTYEGKTLAHLLIDQGKHDALDKWRDEKGNTVSLRAAATGRADLLKTLLNKKVFNPSGVMRSQRSPLATAASYGQVNAFRAIATHRDGQGLLSQPDARGAFPIHLAASWHTSELLKVICEEYSVDLSALTRKKDTPLHMALSARCPENAIFLIRRLRETDQAALDVANAAGRTPLHLAACHGFAGAVRELIQSNVNLQTKDGEGNTALHLVAEHGHTEPMEDLFGADPHLINVTNLADQTPLDVAKQHNRAAAVNYLRVCESNFRNRVAEPAIRIRNVVFKGGGVKGIAEVGAWKRLCEIIKLHQSLNVSDIKRVAGTSAGAIMAMLVVLNIPPDSETATDDNEKTMVSILKKFNDINQLFDVDPSVKTIGNKAKEYVQTGAVGFDMFTSIFSPKDFSEWATFFYSNPALCKGDRLLQMLRDLLKESVGNGMITFAELAQHNKISRELWVVATNLTQGCVQIFNSGETPHACVADAVRCSIAFPMFFQPHYRYDMTVQDGARSYKRHEDVMVDGGVMMNYPIRVFDDLDLPDATIGMRLMKQSKVNPDLEPSSKKKSSSFDGSVLLKGLLGCMGNVQGQVEDQDNWRSIWISDVDKKTLESKLKAGDFQSLLNAGRVGVDDYFNKHKDRFKPKASPLRLIDAQLQLLVPYLRSAVIASDSQGRYLKNATVDKATPDLLVELLDAAELGTEQDTIASIQHFRMVSPSVVEGALQKAVKLGKQRVIEALVQGLGADPNNPVGLLDLALQIEDEKLRSGTIKTLAVVGCSTSRNFEHCRREVSKARQVFKGLDDNAFRALKTLEEKLK